MLTSLAKKPLRPQLVAAFYEKLALMFWSSKDHLYHALALLKLYKLSKLYNRTLTKEQLMAYVGLPRSPPPPPRPATNSLLACVVLCDRMASTAALAVLAVPVGDSDSEDDFFEFNSRKEKNLRVAAILGYSTAVRRELLVDEVVRAKRSTQFFH